MFPLGQLSAQRRSGELGVARMGQKNGLLAGSQLSTALSTAPLSAALSTAPLSIAPLSTAHAGCWDSALQPQGDKCAHGNEQSGTNAHAPKNLPRRWLIFRYGHRRGKRCDVAAGCRRSEAHEFRAELAYLSYLERQPPRMRSCIMRLIASSILVSPSAHSTEKCCVSYFIVARGSGILVAHKYPRIF